MGSPKKNTAILLIHCPDQKGIVAAISDFLLSLLLSFAADSAADMPAWPASMMTNVFFECS